jgi:hypothetical protein
VVNAVPIISTKIKGRPLRERLLATFGAEMLQCRSMQKARDFLNRRPVRHMSCDELLLAADASHNGNLPDYLEAMHKAAVDFAGLPCQVKEIERIARCALEYVRGQPRPDLKGNGRGSLAEPELSGMKGS